MRLFVIYLLVFGGLLLGTAVFSETAQKNLIGLFSRKDPLPPKADLIAFAAHGATKTRVTAGSGAVTERAHSLSSFYPEALVAFGSFTGNPKDGVEERFRREVFPKGLYAGSVISTVQEAMAIKSALPQGFSARSIIFVTDESHSARAGIVWKKLFPEADVHIVAIPVESAIDPESPMFSFRTVRNALWVEMGPTPIYWIMPTWMMKRTSLLFHQPISKD